MLSLNFIAGQEEIECRLKNVDGVYMVHDLMDHLKRKENDTKLDETQIHLSITNHVLFEELLLI